VANKKKRRRRTSLVAGKARSVEDAEPRSICIRCAEHPALKRFVEEHTELLATS
jgi:hypothetical protein